MQLELPFGYGQHIMETLGWKCYTITLMLTLKTYINGVNDLCPVMVLIH